MTDSSHIDVYLQVNGRMLKHVGHTDVLGSDDVRVRQALATFFHKLAWEFESDAEGFEGSADEVRAPKPRRVITPAGDEFFEVAPDEFVVGASWDDAIESYAQHGESCSFDAVNSAYPRARWEYI